MRNIKVMVITLVAAMGVFNAQAQFADNAVKINLFGILINQYQIGYERALNENVSVQLQAGIISRPWDGLDVADEWDVSQGGFIVIPEGRYYFSEGLKGAYAGAFFRYRSVSWDYEDLNTIDGYNNSWTQNRSAYGGGVVLGYQAVMSDALVVDIFVGPQYKSVTAGDIEYTSNFDPSYSNSDDEAETSGTGIRFGVNVGYAF